MAQCREITDLLKQVRKQGFEVEKTRSQHYKIKRDGKTVATLPGTPGGGGTAVKQIIKREHPKLVAAGFKGEFRW